jgi:chromosomal replication initiation ATPase DnaA
MNETETHDASLAPTPSLRDIEAAACARFGLTVEQLRGPRRNIYVARPRQIVMYLAREMTPLSYPRIGAHFHRDHTTVLSGERRIRELMLVKPKLAAYVREVRALVRPREKEKARELAQQPLVTKPRQAEAETGGGHK